MSINLDTEDTKIIWRNLEEGTTKQKR